MNKLITTVDQAIQIINKGGVGVIPTDTVYGLVARAEDPKAVARMYTLKNRDHKPSTIIAANTEQLIKLGVDPAHINKAKKWWPNPLSVETPLGEDLSYLHQGTRRQGFRVVSDEKVRYVLEKTGPLVTSSANHPGKPGSVTAHEAIAYFDNLVDFYIDGGDLSGRAPSTIIKITDSGDIEVVREGAIMIHTLAEGGAVIQPGCVFCLENGILKDEVTARTKRAYLIANDHVGVPGAYMIIPLKHTTNRLPDWWQEEINELLEHVPSLDGNTDYNISTNFGRNAGQTQPHLQTHIIPRTPEQGGLGLGGLIRQHMS